MKVTLLTKTGEQVELIGEVYPPFPKQFVCRRENGELANFYTWELELLAVDQPPAGRAPATAQAGEETNA